MPNDTSVFNNVVEVTNGHYVKVFSIKEAWSNFIAELNGLGCPTVEGPALWPTEFCGDALDMQQDMWMNLATIDIQGRGLLVLASSVEEGDQMHRFHHQYGPAAIHHAALLCEEMHKDAELFCADGWSKASAEPAQDGDLSQWFLKNPANQILELIARPNKSHKTFTCNNIKFLRVSEGR